MKRIPCVFNEVAALGLTQGLLIRFVSLVIVISLVKFVSIGVHEETKKKLEAYVIGRESWDETLNRILTCWGECAGMLALDAEDLDLLGSEMKATGSTVASETLHKMLRELVSLRGGVSAGEKKA
jgi:hypothetical protein